MNKRFTIIDISTMFEAFKDSVRVDIAYYDAKFATKDVIVLWVPMDVFGNGDDEFAMYSIAKAAAIEVGSNLIGDAIMEWYSKSCFTKHKSLYDNFSKIQFNVNQIQYNPPADFSIKKKPDAEGPKMEEIDALPGIRMMVQHPLEDRVSTIRDIIISLNDKHTWTREAVADWLDTLDVDLRFKAPDDRLKEERQQELGAKVRRLESKIKDATNYLNKLQKEMEQATKSLKELEDSL